MSSNKKRDTFTSFHPLSYNYPQIGAGEVAEVNHLNQRGKIKRTDPNYQALLKNVKPHILERVLNIYYLDFVMFGYDIKPFLEILSRKKESANNKS